MRKRWFCKRHIWSTDHLDFRHEAAQAHQRKLDVLVEHRLSEISSSYPGALSPDPLPSIPRPEAMKNLEKAADRLAKALQSGEKITIFGDYDVDGTASCALLFRFFKEYGYDINFYIPNRMTEGYGLNPIGVRKVSEQGTKVIITVDNGISAVDACSTAHSLGIDVIVTDHHEPPQVLPSAFAIINPKQPGCPFPYKDLAGVGVAFYLAVALRRSLSEMHPAIRPNLRRYLDFVAIGTIADMCPLNGLNHVLTRLGLEALAENRRAGKRLGIDSLARVAGLSPESPLSAEQIAFQIGPRLNAAGRLGTAMKTAELLSTEDPLLAETLARELDSENRARRLLEKETFTQIQSRLAASTLIQSQQESSSLGKERHSLVLAGKDWHPGVLGIVASRCVEKYYKPTLVLTETEGILKGSGRSTEEINLFEALSPHRSAFISFGGHAKAVGFSLALGQEKWLEEILESAVKATLTEHTPATALSMQSLSPLAIDGVLEIEDIGHDLLGVLSKLEPFGFGNSRPRFALKNVLVKKCRSIGKNPSDGHCVIEVCKTGELILDAGDEGIQKWLPSNSGTCVSLTAFSMYPELLTAFTEQVPLHLAIEVSEGFWNGRRKLEIRVTDFGPASGFETLPKKI